MEMQNLKLFHKKYSSLKLDPKISHQNFNKKKEAISISRQPPIK